MFQCVADRKRNKKGDGNEGRKTQRKTQRKTKKNKQAKAAINDLKTKTDPTPSSEQSTIHLT